MSATIPDCVVQRGAKAVAIYEQSMRVDGSPRFAEMLAMQSPPACMTDSVFMAGIGTLDQQLSPQKIKKLKENAAKQGVTLSGNEFYHPGLNRNNMALDPYSCVSNLKELKDKLAAAGKGTLNQRTHEVTLPEPLEDPYAKPIHKLNPRIVKRIMRQEIQHDPSKATMDKRELAEAIIDTHGS